MLTLQADRYGFKSQFSHSLAVTLCTIDSTSSVFSICKMGITRPPSSPSYCWCDDSCDEVHTHCSFPEATFPSMLLHHLHGLGSLFSQEWLCSFVQTLQSPLIIWGGNQRNKMMKTMLCCNRFAGVAVQCSIFTKTHWIVHAQWVNFMVCELDINKINNGERSGNHSSTLAWEIPWTEEPGVLQSTGCTWKSQTQLSDQTPATRK